MASNNRLYRNFVILQEDERGYANSEDKTLSGYSKIEEKGDKCKISFYAQNLKKDNDKYYMVLICSKKDIKQIVNLGPLEVTDKGINEVVSCEIYDVWRAVRRMVEFIAGLFIGAVAGVAVMSLCAAAKERDEL